MTIFIQILVYLSVVLSTALSLVLVLGFLRQFQIYKYNPFKFIIEVLPRFLVSPYFIVFFGFGFILKSENWYFLIIFIIYTLLFLVIILRKKKISFLINTKIIRCFIVFLIFVTVLGTIIGFNFPVFTPEIIAQTFTFLICLAPFLFSLNVLLMYPFELIIGSVNKCLFYKKLNKNKPIIIIVNELKDGVVQDVFVSLDFKYKVVPVTIDNFYEDVNNGVKQKEPLALLLDEVIVNDFFKDYKLTFTITGKDLSLPDTKVEKVENKNLYFQFQKAAFLNNKEILAYGFSFKPENV